MWENNDLGVIIRVCGCQGLEEAGSGGVTVWGVSGSGGDPRTPPRLWVGAGLSRCSSCRSRD